MKIIPYDKLMKEKHPSPKELMYENILMIKSETERRTGIPDLSSRIRKSEYIYARQLYACISVIIFGYPHNHTGKAIGRTHATVINSIKRLSGFIEAESIPEELSKLITEDEVNELKSNLIKIKREYFR